MSDFTDRLTELGRKAREALPAVTEGARRGVQQARATADAFERGLDAFAEAERLLRGVFTPKPPAQLPAPKSSDPR